MLSPVDSLGSTFSCLRMVTFAWAIPEASVVEAVEWGKHLKLHCLAWNIMEDMPPIFTLTWNLGSLRPSLICFELIDKSHHDALLCWISEGGTSFKLSFDRRFVSERKEVYTSQMQTYLQSALFGHCVRDRFYSQQMDICGNMTSVSLAQGPPSLFTKPVGRIIVMV